MMRTLIDSLASQQLRTTDARRAPCAGAGGADARAAADASVGACSARSCARSSSTPPTRRASSGRPKRCGALGERVAARGRRGRAGCCGELGLSDAEIRLARIDPGYATASTAARADAFLLPDSLQFAEYNARDPGRRRLQPAARRALRRRAADGSASASASTCASTADRRACSTRCSPATASGAARAIPPRIAIVDWREVPTWSEFELLRDAFTAPACRR